MDAMRAFQTTESTLRTMLQVAQAQAQATCRQAGLGSAECRQARQTFMTTVAGLRAQLAAAQASERSAYQTALQQFRDAVNAALHGR